MLIAVLKTLHLFGKGEIYGASARFWARFSHCAGPVVGQTLFMEGVFAFFAESTFLGVFLLGEKRVSPFKHWLSAVAVGGGAVLSGYFIVATNAWMQHPSAIASSMDARS